MNYSPFIKKNISAINSLGYKIYPNESQVYKKFGNYEVIISGFSMKSWIFNYVEVVNVLVWIKQTNTEKILVEKRSSGSLLLPSIKKINNFILESITKLESRCDIPE